MQDFIISIFDWAIAETVGFSIGNTTMIINAFNYIAPVFGYISFFLPMDVVFYILEMQMAIWAIRCLIALWNTILQLT